MCVFFFKPHVTTVLLKCKVLFVQCHVSVVCLNIMPTFILVIEFIKDVFIFYKMLFMRHFSYNEAAQSDRLKCSYHRLWAATGEKLFCQQIKILCQRLLHFLHCFVLLHKNNLPCLSDQCHVLHMSAEQLTEHNGRFVLT